ncbi:Fer-1-related [Plakobranchus ocellatus]|uniref:Fer-1-related n=1 Tax=Plakobranchus ocellatus TaxID=259542 RepID=A0AAV4D1M9_9GAST|nr:Fer-1-related [Plakobranchus ocellatus]
MILDKIKDAFNKCVHPIVEFATSLMHTIVEFVRSLMHPKKSEPAKSEERADALSTASWPAKTSEPAEDAFEPAKDVFEPGKDALEPGKDALEPGKDALEPAKDALEPAKDAEASGENMNNSSLLDTAINKVKAFLSRFKKVDLEEKKRLERIAYKKRYQAMEESELTAQEVDWWSKFYASTNDLEKCKKYRTLGYDTLQILPSSLEKVPEFSNFDDFCATLQLTRGKNDDDEDENVIGEFKGSFRVYPLPPDPSEPLPPKVFQLLPPSDPEECIIRLYVIRAVDLQPNDPNGLADPYIEVKLGKTKMDTRDDYIPNTICPTFGRLFEMKTLLPLHKDLIIRIKDYDLLSSDDIIGETTIDLENRYLTNFRATCGLPKTYWTSGINLWRDSQKPVDLLKWFCTKNRLGDVVFNGPVVSIGNKMYKLSDFESEPPLSKHMGPPDQRLALHVLNLLPLVKEHVESRPLYNPLQPNIEQGRLQMWVDIFPTSMGPPGPPFDISPRKPQKFVLRVVIWNTKDVILEEESITGEKMSDIYLKGWMGGIDEKQKTDVHYRSLDGEGNFNWRMVFPFDYQVAEQTMVVKKKEHFWSLDETTLSTTPKFITQVWDNDKFSADDFIGHLELNLSAMPMPAKKARSCKLTMLPDVGKDVKLVSLFEMKHMRGFWPCYDDSTGTRVLTVRETFQGSFWTSSLDVCWRQINLWRPPFTLQKFAIVEHFLQIQHTVTYSVA